MRPRSGARAGSAGYPPQHASSWTRSSACRSCQPHVTRLSMPASPPRVVRLHPCSATACSAGKCARAQTISSQVDHPKRANGEQLGEHRLRQTLRTHLVFGVRDPDRRQERQPLAANCHATQHRVGREHHGDQRGRLAAALGETADGAEVPRLLVEIRAGWTTHQLWRGGGLAVSYRGE